MDFSKVPTDPWGFTVWIISAILLAIAFVPKFIKEHKTESGMIDRLTRELARSYEDKEQAVERADQFAAQRNELILQFSDMKRDNALVLERLAMLTEQNVTLVSQNRQLAADNQMLVARVEQLTSTLESMKNGH